MDIIAVLVWTIFGAFLLLGGGVFFYNKRVEKYLRLHHPASFERLSPSVAPVGFIYGRVLLTFDFLKTLREIKADQELSADTDFMRRIIVLKNLMILWILAAILLIAILILKVLFFQ